MHILFSIIIIIFIIILFTIVNNHLKEKSKELFKCIQNTVNYNDYCDVNECDNVCEPTRLHCNPLLNKCRWNQPQKENSSCINNNECISGFCYYDKSGKNSGIGYCL
jgi:hypothetical protein